MLFNQYLVIKYLCESTIYDLIQLYKGIKKYVLSKQVPK